MCKHSRNIRRSHISPYDRLDGFNIELGEGGGGGRRGRGTVQAKNVAERSSRSEGREAKFAKRASGSEASEVREAKFAKRKSMKFAKRMA